MNIKRTVIDLSKKGVSRANEITDTITRNRHCLDLVLSWSLNKMPTDQELSFPLSYLELLSDCLGEKNIHVQEIKSESNSDSDIASKRFSSLIDTLHHLPPLDFSVVEDIAKIADHCRGNLQSMESSEWMGDVRSHFEMSSSFGVKGRILATITRFMRCKNCLELGTAYGMSALFILESINKLDANFQLATIEGGEPQFSIASELLKKRYGDHVNCEFGWTYDVLPKLVPTLAEIDFLFHDAGHSKKDYIQDFEAVLPALSSGAVAIIDDIRWADSRFYEGDPQCYEGWMEIVKNPRVRRAVEVDKNIGVLLLS